jgi:hypothetical protein
MEDGKIRGFLCRECSAGLMGFRADPDRLRAAVDYLKQDRRAISANETF